MGNQEMTDPKALAVNSTPVIPGTSCIPVKMSTKAVSVQIKTVSIKGSIRPTNPSDAGLCVLVALWAMAAEPTPASFENAARWKPIIKTPIKPPFKALEFRAPL